MEQENIKKTKTVFKVIFAWQDEKEEKWLEEMAASGWHLLSVAPFVYTFQRGTPEVVTYRLDYKLTTNKDYPEYVSIFRDSGWELVASMANWHYYRIKSENSNTPEYLIPAVQRLKNTVVYWQYCFHFFQLTW